MNATTEKKNNCHQWQSTSARCWTL